MLLNFLPQKIVKIINTLNMDKLTEIRLRLNLPIYIKYDFKKYYLSENSLTKAKDLAIISTKEIIDETISLLTEKSLYAHNERLKNGYLISKDGIRVGISGETVYDKEVVTIKNITSMLIRIPHKIINASNKAYNYLFENGNFLSTLIISPPGFGKTTMIKDLIYKLSNSYEILVIDERGELYDENINADYIRFSNKEFGYEKGLRVMSPEIVVFDEIISEYDALNIEKISESGVLVIASIHAKTFENAISKHKLLLNSFDRFITLKSKQNAGEIDCIYDRHNRKLNA
jgi:stage III sporulation protein AA